jgi:RND family efflux transporter MFP subunit
VSLIFNWKPQRSAGIDLIHTDLCTPSLRLPIATIFFSATGLLQRLEVEIEDTAEYALGLCQDETVQPMRSQELTIVALVAGTLLSGCQRESETPAPEVRPVRTVTIVKSEAGETVTYTGRIQAEADTRLAFRIAGRIIERSVNVGDGVEPAQLVAKLEPQDEMNALRSAQANLLAAQARSAQAVSNLERQRTLLASHATPRAQFEQAQQEQDTSRAQIDIAKAQLKAAEDRLSYTELKADSAGVVTATGAEPGEVVQAGQMIVRVALSGGRDAVFDVPGALLRAAPSDPLITVSLTDASGVTVTGRVREVSPQADPITGTFEVKVGLTNPPKEMRLGSIVAGRLKLDATPVMEIPASALTDLDQRPAVWIVDASSMTVSMRNVDLLRQNAATVAVSKGLDSGEIVVTAGVQALHPGQKVRLLGPPR